MHTVFALLCFVVVIHWLIFPYPSGLLHWHCGNLTIAPVPAKQPWWIWINTSCEFIMNDCITTTKQSTTKPCAYFLGYTVPTCNKSFTTPLCKMSWWSAWSFPCQTAIDLNDVCAKFGVDVFNAKGAIVSIYQPTIPDMPKFSYPTVRAFNTGCYNIESLITRFMGPTWGPSGTDCYLEYIPPKLTLRARQDGHHFADDIFKCIIANENFCISNKISLKYVPWGLTDNKPSLVQIMGCCRKRRWAIIWTNDGIVYWRIYASLSELSLNQLSASHPF